MVSVKDTRGTYVGVNRAFVRRAGRRRHSDVIGRRAATSSPRSGRLVRGAGPCADRHGQAVRNHLEIIADSQRPGRRAVASHHEGPQHVRTTTASSWSPRRSTPNSANAPRRDRPSGCDRTRTRSLRRRTPGERSRSCGGHEFGSARTVDATGARHLTEAVHPADSRRARRHTAGDDRPIDRPDRSRLRLLRPESADPPVPAPHRRDPYRLPSGGSSSASSVDVRRTTDDTSTIDGVVRGHDDLADDTTGLAVAIGRSIERIRTRCPPSGRGDACAPHGPVHAHRHPTAAPCTSRSRSATGSNRARPSRSLGRRSTTARLRGVLPIAVPVGRPARLLAVRLDAGRGGARAGGIRVGPRSMAAHRRTSTDPICGFDGS